MSPSHALLVLAVVLSACGAGPSAPGAAAEPRAAVEPVAAVPATPVGNGWFVVAMEPGVRLQFPAPPRAMPHEVLTPFGSIEQRRVSASAGAVTYMLAVSELPESVVTQLGFAEIFEASRAAALAPVAGRAEQHEVGVHEGFPGQRIELSGEQGAAIDGEMLMVVAGRRLVQVLATAPQGRLDRDAVERVFASLHLSDGTCAHENMASAPVQVARVPQVGAVYRLRGEFNGDAAARLDLGVTIVATPPEHIEIDVVFHAFPAHGNPPAGATPGLTRRVLVSRGEPSLEYRVQGGDEVADYMKAILDSYDLMVCDLPAVAHTPGELWKWPDNRYFTSSLLGVVDVDGARWASFVARGPEIDGEVEPRSLNFRAVSQRVRVDDGFVGRCAIELVEGDESGRPTQIVHLIEVERVR